MKVRLFHFKSPPTATNANWASKWYYKSLRWDFSQIKTQQCKKETSRKQSCCFTYGNDSQQGTPGNAWRSMGCHQGRGTILAAGGSEMPPNILQGTETASSSKNGPGQMYWGEKRWPMGLSTAGVPHLRDLMPADLRWRWCHNTKNKAHRKRKALESSRNPPLPPCASPWLRVHPCFIPGNLPHSFFSIELITAPKTMAPQNLQGEFHTLAVLRISLLGSPHHSLLSYVLPANMFS